uniref:Secretoglobin family 3A member 1 n=1 Tax=Myotis myotis TaxID=51298 RepID=A0A7J7XKJ5_MYOMY|nr:secretoglobin family 3A member 1 [Myotis myotis]
MKLAAAFLVLSVALLSQPTALAPAAALAPALAPVAALAPAAALAPVAALEAGVESVAGAAAPSFFKGFNPLRFILTSMGINVERLVEGSRKCVTEVGPDAMGAMGAVKALLRALTFFG